MEKRIICFVLTIVCFFGVKNNVLAYTIKKEDVPNSTYVIGTHMFTRDINSETGYNGQLTTKYIMLAADTVNSTNINDMMVYYKTARGEWIDGVSGETVQMQDEIEIEYKDTIEITELFPENVIDVYFLNTQNDSYQTNQSIILKTSSGKIILIDTANRDETLFNIILNKLKNISSDEIPVIDYLLISHSHNDHSGNLKEILSSDELIVKNVIYKDEILGATLNGKTVQNVIKNNKKSETNVIETTSLLETNKSIKRIDIDNNVSMLLMNLTDVYSGRSREECDQNYYSIKFHSSSNYNIKYNNNYIYLNSLDPQDNTLKFSSIIENTSESLGLSNGFPVRKYYAYYSERTSLCNANANSIAVLFEVKNKDGAKYIYVPSDLENNGYSFFGNESSSALNSGFTYSKIYGSGTTYVYKNTYDGSNNIDNAWDFANDFFVDSSTIKIASESRVANIVKNYIGEENLNNIVIYQQSHHGFNNAKDAIDRHNRRHPDQKVHESVEQLVESFE